MDPNLLLLAAVLGLIPASVAQRKGYSFVEWWILGFVMLIVALPWALWMKPNSKKLTKCRHCGSTVPVDASVCRHCTRSLLPA